MSHPRRKYDPEFKAGAVRIVRETRRPISEIARELGIGAGVLCERSEVVAIGDHRNSRRRRTRIPIRGVVVLCGGATCWTWSPHRRGSPPTR